MNDGTAQVESTNSQPGRPPRVPKIYTKQLTESDRIRIQTLRGIGWTYDRISKHFGYTHGAVPYACTHPAAPDKHTGRPSKLTEEQIDGLIDFLNISKENHRVPL